MIPYRLQFHGIRDYQPTQMTFGDETEHILITGPNGTGKSTIAFCFGAVLNSAKVAPEGLRSNNLPADQEWRAMIQLIFHNAGRTQIDAPPYIAFRLNIVQATQNSLVQRQFTILTGDTSEDLKEIDVFRSGDPNGRNFKAYEEELFSTYKIFPDAYYLIWYQQEVNQFSTMSPEERFRRFSDMYGISGIQQLWESFVEQAKETEEVLRTARSVVKEATANLNFAKHEFDLFKRNKQRLHTYGTQQVQTTRSMQAAYTQQITQIATSQLANSEHTAQLEVTIQKLAKQLGKIDIDLHNQQNNLASSQTGLSRKQEIVGQATAQLKNIEQQIQSIREQLQETEDQRKRLRYTEQQTLTYAQQTTDKITAIDEKQQLLTVEKQQQVAENTNLQTQIIETNLHIQQILKEQAGTKELLTQYTSSHAVQQQIESLQQQLRIALAKEVSLQTNLAILQNSIAMLRKNQIYSPRQQMGLAELKRQGIKAYALRDLVEMTTLKEEVLLNPIKYTIFYDTRHAQPVNDLYYVSLQQIIPDRSVTSIPSLQLKMRSGLSEIEQNYASKALWWIEQFLITSPRLQNGQLQDARGVRGAQEAASYILSDQALQKQLQADEQSLQQQQQTLQELQNQQQLWQQKMEEYSLLLPALRKAEAQQLEANYVSHHTSRLISYEEQLLTGQTKVTALENAILQHIEERALFNHELKTLKQELAIYERLGQLKALQEQQHSLNEQRSTIQFLLDDEQKKMRTIQENIQVSNEKIQQLTASKQTYNFDLKHSETTLQALANQQLQQQEELETLKATILHLSMELNELEKIIPALYEEATELPLLEESISSLLALNAEAKSRFDEARMQQVNPNAESNYLAVQKDYEDKQLTARETEVLLESTEQHAREVESNLDTTINMHVRTIHSLFEQFMEQFNFEGKVEFERFLDNKNRAIFKLYIKVRKIGHKGALEDVSVKARNGRYGKGVSGGEESLSSLLFALALLQNLHVNPNFIMLDEFDSALDDARKERVFDLYAATLNRKLFILSPKAHSDDYYHKFARAFIVEHNALIPRSGIRSIYQK